MPHRKLTLKTLALGSCALGALIAGPAAAEQFAVPSQELRAALQQFASQGDQQVLFSSTAVAGKHSAGFTGDATPEAALQALLAGTDLVWSKTAEGALLVKTRAEAADPQSGSAVGDGADAGTVQALVVTAQKREENIQDVPIAMSAFTQEALERSQVAGGPDLMTQVPNMTFTKTNFTSYSIQIRGVGTQAISATTDAAVAVAFNNTPFIRNRFFEQEFYDLQRVEVLRGPQGTLYGRNATAGVVNLISQKPKFVYEGKLSADMANYQSTRLEGMLNIPLVDDKVALRIAGAWTKRDGYDTNQITGNQIDGRDLWSTRVSLRVSPSEKFNANLIWEHFEENDDRLRSGKQLCHQDDRTVIGGLQASWEPSSGYSDFYSQGCYAASLYSPDSFEAPNGYSLPYYLPLHQLGLPITDGFNPYSSLVQSPDLRVIESTVDPKYKANSDLVELQVDYQIGDSFTLTSETGYNYDTIFSQEDYNRFNTASGAFGELPMIASARQHFTHLNAAGNWEFCDPQLGCADRVVAVDVSRAKSSQFSQEFRLTSDFSGPFNFSGGINFLRYDTEDKYYVFINTLTMLAAAGGSGVQGPLSPYVGGVTDNRECLPNGNRPPNTSSYEILSGCIYIDPNPIENVNDQGHNYFLSRNPYKLISYAAFGEAYYNITDNLKLTAGLRITRDQKQAPRRPSWLLAASTVGLPVMNVEEQTWTEPTGRLTLDWKPHLSFTDETLVYGSFSHGYKAGGSNPPPSGVVAWGLALLGGGANSSEGAIVAQQSALKPKTFDPEFVNAFEVGTKNTLLDGRLTLNADAFFYDYTGYQISQIIDRSAVNYNFDAKIWGLELEADWRPLENLRLGFKGGYEKTRMADGDRAIDIMDRTGGHDDWVVIRPFPSFPSNCVVPAYVFDLYKDGVARTPPYVFASGFMGPCELAYVFDQDPVTKMAYVANPTEAKTSIVLPPEPIGNFGIVDYIGYNPDADVGQNHGEGFFKDLSGHELPNAPHFTATVTADYTVPLPSNWLMTLHTDLYYQSEAWTRVFNTPGYDKLKAYTNVNLAAIFTNEDAGWKVMAYVKNVMDRDSITGAFLNSDDTGLTTNVFLTEPRLYGLRVTKDFNGGAWWTGANQNHPSGEPYPLTIEVGGSLMRADAPYASVGPDFFGDFSPAISPLRAQHRDLDWGDGREIRATYRPAAEGLGITVSYRWGDANGGLTNLHGIEAAGPLRCVYPPDFIPGLCDPGGFAYNLRITGENWSDSTARENENYSIADFAVGRDFGFGGWGHSTLKGGLRYARLKSVTGVTLDGIPNLKLPDGFGLPFIPTTFDHYRADITAEREFKGAGPELSWDAARHLLGDQDDGYVDLNWSVSGGALFGRQKTRIDGTTQDWDFSGLYQLTGVTVPVLPEEPVGVPARSATKTIPFLDLSAGLSYEIQRVRIAAGYRWERYYKALDAGYAEHKSYDRTIDGPYFKIAVGFGG